MRYRLVAELSEKAVTVGALCCVLGVSRSGYYGSRQRASSATEICATSIQLKAEFAVSGKVYGSRRLCAVLLNDAAEVRSVTDARQRACGNRSEPSALDAAHGGHWVHLGPISGDRVTSFRRVRQASLAGPEFFGPAGAASGWCHRR